MCVLRVSGDPFDPQEAVRPVKLKASRTVKAGEPRWPSRPGGRTNTHSGITVDVSDAAWTLRDQVADAERFVVRFESDLITLSSMEGVDDVRLDFPVSQRDVAAQSECFPPALVRAAGRAGIGLEITLYRVSGDEEDGEDTDASGAA